MSSMSKGRKYKRYKLNNVTIEDIAIDLLPYAYKIVIPAIISLALVIFVSNFIGKNIAESLIGIRTLSPVFFFNHLLETGIALPSALAVAGIILLYKKLKQEGYI